MANRFVALADNDAAYAALDKLKSQRLSAGCSVLPTRNEDWSGIRAIAQATG